jgi:hypothetical protein
MFEETYSTIFGIFASNEWKTHGIKTVPQDTVLPTGTVPFVRVSVLPSAYGVNIVSLGGMVMLEIYTPSGDGPALSVSIADKLRSLISNKSLTAPSGRTVQFRSPTLSAKGADPRNSSLSKSVLVFEFTSNEVF